MTFFTEFKGDVKFLQIFTESITLYWYVFLLGIAFLLILIYFSGSYLKNSSKYSGYYNKSIDCTNIKTISSKFYLYQIIALIITAPLFIIGVRGGVTRTIRPITLSNANDFAERAIHTSAILNTPFSLIRTIGKNGFQYQKFFTEKKMMDSYFTPVHDNLNVDTLASSPIKIINGDNIEGKNIVIIILESFAAENMKFLHKNLDKNYTPFLDSLSKNGVLCTNAFANGAKSIDAVPSILASIPSLINSFAVTPYSTDQIYGLPYYLSKKGYYTAFFHGAPNNSMGIRAVANSCGVSNYFGKDEYGNDKDFDGSWGIWDELFLQFVAKKIGTFQQPFMSTIFTLSSHHPFKVPDQYKDVLPSGKNPLQQAIAYADISLQKFFKSIENEPWFRNTLFILTPDHGTVADLYPKYITSIGRTMIPIIYYAPGIIESSIYTQTTQQIDIMPTILGLLDNKDPYVAFGRDINNNRLNPFAINYSDNLFQMVTGDILIQRDDSKITGVYNYQKDSLLNSNLLQSHDIKNTWLIEHDEFFKAFIQQYVNRLIDDELVVK